MTVRWLSTISHVDANRIVVERMRLDDAGKPQPTGEYETLAADAVVLAIGQDTDLRLLDTSPEVDKTNGLVGVDHNIATGHRGLWAGGDIVADQHTVTAAIGHGTRAAAIDAYLGASTGGLRLMIEHQPISARCPRGTTATRPPVSARSSTPHGG